MSSNRRKLLELGERGRTASPRPRRAPPPPRSPTAPLPPALPAPETAEVVEVEDLGEVVAPNGWRCRATVAIRRRA